MDQNEIIEQDDVLPLTADDIEAAYERALMVMETVEVGVEQLDAAAAEVVESPDPVEESPAVEEPWDLPAAEPVAVSDTSAPVLHPREIIEAALFVGGPSLTTKRLSQMLGSHESPERVDAYIDELNAIYRDQSRPYAVDFGEGGYRLVVLPEFEPVRRSVFGAGPKEVKLSQDALEVLAFVAYRQPVTVDDVEGAGKSNAAVLLRQLVRRQLVELQRSDDGPVTYSSTPRFLDLFGLRSLDDLPFPDDLNFK